MRDRSNQLSSNAETPTESDDIGFMPSAEAFQTGREGMAAVLIVNDRLRRPVGTAQLTEPNRRDWWIDKIWRIVGLVFIGVAALAARYLYISVWQGAPHGATWLELLLAAIAFLGASAGSVLVALGIHVFDQVEVSERWRHR